jgi:hypothetical protein
MSLETISPPDFPFVTFGNTQFWGGHISLAGLFETMRFLTNSFDANAKATQLLVANGLTVEL